MKQKKKICILAPVHPPFDVRVFTKEAVSFVDAGYAVVLYVRGEKDEVCKGVKIKVLKYQSRLHRFLLIPHLIWRAYREKADVYHLHNPDTIVVGWFLKLLRKTVVYDTHEDYIARIPTKQWIPSVLRQVLAHLVDGMERIMARYADGVVVTQPHQVAKFNGILVENYPRIEPDLIKRVYQKADKISTGEELRLIYIGETNPHRGMFFMLDILVALNKQVPARLWMTGTDHGEGWIAQAREHAAWSHVDHLGYLPDQEDVFAYLSKADFGMALFEDIGDLSRISSNKIYEYQTYGTPFLATALDARKAILGESCGGIFVEPNDIDAAVKAILAVYHDTEVYQILVENGRRLIFEERNWESEEGKLLEFYRSLV